MFFNDYYNSPIGNITMASDGESLCGLWFDGQKYFASTVKGETEDKTMPVFEQTKKWLDIYFSGNEPDFMPKLSLNGSEFSKAVWDILLTIPYGSVTAKLQKFWQNSVALLRCPHRRSVVLWVTIRFR